MRLSAQRSRSCSGVVDVRVGVPWLGGTDQTCRFCQRGQENLCDSGLFTGYTLDGGYAEYSLADERYCLRLPERHSELEAAPVLCAGLSATAPIGWPATQPR